MSSKYLLKFTVFPIIESSKTDGPHCHDVKPNRIKNIVHSIFDYYFSRLKIIKEDCSGYILSGVIDSKEHDIQPTGDLVDYFDKFIQDYIIDLGPDTWMEGDISISWSDILKSSKNKKYMQELYRDDNCYEMFIGVKVNKVFPLNNLIFFL